MDPMRLNLEVVLFDHHRLPRLERLATFKDRVMWRGTEEFLEAIRKHQSFRMWPMYQNHGVTAAACWREDVPEYSLQLVQHGDLRYGDLLIEADIDLANPDYGVASMVQHAFLDIARLGKADPFSIRRGLGLRGIDVPDRRPHADCVHKTRFSRQARAR